MKLVDFLDEDFVIADLQARTKKEVLAELIQPLKNKWIDLDLDKVLSVLLDRENLGTTGIGDGIAIPHGKLEGLKKVVLVIGRSLQGLDFASLDHQPCHIFFLVLAPEKVAGMHLRILAHISRLLQDPSFRQAFLEAPDRKAIVSLLKEA
ncbi:MAG: PTS sugar transporter subunit IIA [Desulfoplanes sp.]